MTVTIPAKRIDKTPRFRFAVLSVEDGKDVAELESSFDSQATAQGVFDRQYSKWGLTHTRFYLVDWEAQTVLDHHPKD
jgi:hypothetical protein